MAKKQKNVKDKTIDKLRDISGKYKNNIGDILSSDEFREAYSDMNYKEKEFCQIILEGIMDGKTDDEIKIIVKNKENEPSKTIVDIATDEDRAKEILLGAHHFVDDDDDMAEPELNKVETDLVEKVLGVETDKPKKVIEVEPEVVKAEEKIEIKVDYLSDVEKNFGTKKTVVQEVIVDETKMEEKVSINVSEPVSETEDEKEEVNAEEPKQDDSKVEYLSDIKARKEAEKKEKDTAEEVKSDANLAMYKETIIEETDHNGVFRTTKSFATDKVKVFETIEGVPLSKEEQNKLWFLKNVFPKKYREIVGG